jgi:hypothetical protein
VAEAWGQFGKPRGRGTSTVGIRYRAGEDIADCEVTVHAIVNCKSKAIPVTGRVGL